ncbi:hypothetical protein [Brevibacillus parabrevis]|uniref:hypothetical protein n=1 Tax=Brevibacillus parabrevis TaxID=54914 RepID=UPI0028D35F20|nr:hypothetical protein [Brevibacillus parabrevis]
MSIALTHEFYLVPNKIEVKQFWLGIENRPEIIDSVKISDDIILYISDTLRWIPSINPALKGFPRGTGINYHGVTLFDAESAQILGNVFDSWKRLFENAPEVLKLTGEYVTIVGKDDSGHYEKLVLNRNEVLKQFEKIASFSNRLDEGSYYLFHCGI